MTMKSEIYVIDELRPSLHQQPSQRKVTKTKSSNSLEGIKRLSSFSKKRNASLSSNSHHGIDTPTTTKKDNLLSKSKKQTKIGSLTRHSAHDCSLEVVDTKKKKKKGNHGFLSKSLHDSNEKNGTDCNEQSNRMQSFRDFVAEKKKEQHQPDEELIVLLHNLVNDNMTDAPSSHHRRHTKNKTKSCKVGNNNNDKNNNKSSLFDDDDDDDDDDDSLGSFGEFGDVDDEENEVNYRDYHHISQDHDSGLSFDEVSELSTASFTSLDASLHDIPRTSMRGRRKQPRKNNSSNLGCNGNKNDISTAVGDGKTGTTIQIDYNGWLRPPCHSKATTTTTTLSANSMTLSRQGSFRSRGSDTIPRSCQSLNCLPMFERPARELERIERVWQQSKRDLLSLDNNLDEQIVNVSQYKNNRRGLLLATKTTSTTPSSPIRPSRKLKYIPASVAA